MEYPIFQASEIIQMALQIEQQGIDFYTALLEKPMEPPVREVIQFLIDQEKKHIDIFTELEQNLGDIRIPETYPGEIQNYMKCFVKDRVFPDPLAEIPETDQPEDFKTAINRAIEFEKQSILFYSGLTHVVQTKASDTIEEIISQEHFHIRELLHLKRRMENTNG